MFEKILVCLELAGPVKQLCPASCIRESERVSKSREATHLKSEMLY